MKRSNIKKIAIAIFVLILAFVLFFVATKIIDKNGQNVADEGDELNRNIETFLIIGVDDFSDKKETYESYNNTMQSDFLVLLIIDTSTEEITALHINRDTMTDITILGVLGEKVGKEEHQIALAHTYGTGDKDSCINTVTAVEDLLGINVDHYARITMDAVEDINDAIGGVKLTPTVSIADAGITEGEELTLTGSQALSYIRARTEVSDGSNLKRMERQRQYMDAFITQAKAKQDDIDSESLFNDISDKLLSDSSVERLESIFKQTTDYTFKGIETLEGEAVVGESGYMEYHLDNDAFQNKIKELFYK